MNETLARAGGRNVLRVERRYPHPPETVWRAISEPAHLAAWFPSEVELDALRPGAEIRFVSAGFGQTGTIREADPPRVLAFDWAGELLRFELAAEDGGTLLVFTHAFDDYAGAASFAAGWEACFDGLGRDLDGDAAAHKPDMAAAHEAYVRRLGLDAGTLVEAPDGGWEIRFERQLVCDAAGAWPLLVPGGALAAGDAPPAGLVLGILPAGPLARVEAPRLLELPWGVDGGPGGIVRWELGEGTGHGARLLLRQTARPSAAGPDRAAALDGWRARVEEIAARAASAR